jgi:hypothetical protein
MIVTPINTGCSLVKQACVVAVPESCCQTTKHTYPVAHRTSNLARIIGAASLSVLEAFVSR